MFRIEEEVWREKRKMEATPEWNRAVADLQQLEHRFHKLRLQRARDEEAHRTHRARRDFFPGQRTPRGEEDRRRSHRRRQDEGERRHSRDRGTGHTSAGEQPGPSAPRPRGPAAEAEAEAEADRSKPSRPTRGEGNGARSSGGTNGGSDGK